MERLRVGKGIGENHRGNLAKWARGGMKAAEEVDQIALISLVPWSQGGKRKGTSKTTVCSREATWHSQYWRMIPD